MADIGQGLQGGWLRNVPPNAPPEVQNAALNDVIDRLNELLKTQIYSDGSSKRLIIGFQKDGWGSGVDFGIKMSKEGVDVTTASDSELLFSMSIDNWTWRNDDGQVVKQFLNESGTDTYYDDSGRNYVNIGLRSDPSTYGFEMAKPNEDLGNDPI